MAAMLQILRVFPCVSSLREAKVVQCFHPGPNIGYKSQQIPPCFPIYPRDQPPGMAADNKRVMPNLQSLWFIVQGANQHF